MTVLWPQQHIVAVHARRDIGLACARIFTTLMPLNRATHLARPSLSAGRPHANLGCVARLIRKATNAFGPDSQSPLRYLVSKSNMGDTIMFLATTVSIRSSRGNGMYAHVTQFTRFVPGQHYSICSDITRTCCGATENNKLVAVQLMHTYMHHAMRTNQTRMLDNN